MVTNFKVYTDASSRYKAIEKDGEEERRRKVHPSSIGAVIKNGTEIVGEISEQVGLQDSNYAEFLAMYKTCRYLIKLKIKNVDFYADCLNLSIMVNQNLVSDIPELRRISLAILHCLKSFDSYTMTWIDRVYNKEAHNLASKAFKVS